MSFIPPSTQFTYTQRSHSYQQQYQCPMPSYAEPLLESSCVTDVKEDDQYIMLSIEMSGVLGKDISVNIQNGILSLSGFRCVRDMDGRVVKRQRLCRRFSVDTNVVDLERATANIWNGALNLYAPKKIKSATTKIPSEAELSPILETIIC